MKKLEERKPKIQETLDDVLIGDEALKNEFGDPVVEVVVLGGIQPSENVKAFLKLPLKFRTYSKPDKDAVKVQVEGRAARQRWIIRDKESQGREEDFEAYRRRKERKEDDKRPLRGSKLDYTKIPVTDFLANKFVNLPHPASEEQEIRI